LPVFSTDTREQAELLVVTFGSRVYEGPLAGRLVCRRVGSADTTAEAMDAMQFITARMTEVYERMLVLAKDCRTGQPGSRRTNRNRAARGPELAD
jgi:hypothetical protein